jgi:flagellar secretion chaperone FliS
MKKSQTELTYLRAAAQNATAVGLVIILYDLLLHDLEQAISAMADRDVERRTAEIKHSLLVLQQLEGSLDKEGGAEAAKTFSQFYSALRSKIFEAHLKASPELLRKQIDLVVDVRQAWQQVDKPNLGPAYAAAEPVASSQAREGSLAVAAAAAGGSAGSMNWTA